jgi:hypothetical protein
VASLFDALLVAPIRTESMGGGVQLARAADAVLAQSEDKIEED